MTNVYDVAAYILCKSGPITAMKLQKLVYYSQAWSLVWDEEPLFENEIQAWVNGPVVPDLYSQHRGCYVVSNLPVGKPDALSPNEKDTIDKVVDFYSQYNPQQLSDLTHMEAPWRDARKGLSEGQRGERQITLDSMLEYYSSL